MNKAIVVLLPLLVVSSSVFADSRCRTDAFGTTTYRSDDGGTVRSRTDSFGTTTFRDDDGNTVRCRTDSFGDTVCRDN